MLSKKLENAINDQIQAEFYSAYLYLSMSNAYAAQNLKGFAHWLKMQYEEERTHALKFANHLLERGSNVTLKAIQAPPTEFGNPVKTFEKVLEHEKKVTGLINKLYELALKEKDYASQPLLQWFINEQVEEESTVSEILGRLKLIGNTPTGVILMDRELASRVNA